MFSSNRFSVISFRPSARRDSSGRDRLRQITIFENRKIEFTFRQVSLPSNSLFHPGNDPTASPVTRKVISATVIGCSDITVGVLDSPVPVTIAFN